MAELGNALVARSVGADKVGWVVRLVAAGDADKPKSELLGHETFMLWLKDWITIETVPLTAELAAAWRGRLAAKAVAERAQRAARKARLATYAQEGPLDRLADAMTAEFERLQDEEALLLAS